MDFHKTVVIEASDITLDTIINFSKGVTYNIEF